MRHPERLSLRRGRLCSPARVWPGLDCSRSGLEGAQMRRPPSRLGGLLREGRVVSLLRYASAGSRTDRSVIARALVVRAPIFRNKRLPSIPFVTCTAMVT